MMNNRGVKIISTIIRNIMKTAFESKVSALLINDKGDIMIRNDFWELGHTQPTMPLKTDN